MPIGDLVSRLRRWFTDRRFAPDAGETPAFPGRKPPGFRGTGRKPPGFRGTGAGRSAAQAPGPADRSSEAGYNLVVLAVLITVMNIAVAAALPYWSSWAKREKEAELIFRGLQYAEAIRLFRVRQGRLPTALEELIEVEPRVIRQLWPNPMDEEGRWGLLMQGAPSNAGQQENRRARRAGTTNAGAAGGAGGGALTAVPPPNEEEGEGPTVGPILGVYSATPGPSMRVWGGQEDYESWYFTSELIQLRPGNVTDGRPPPRLTSEWIGKPFPPGLLENSKVQDGSAPGERNRERNR